MQFTFAMKVIDQFAVPQQEENAKLKTGIKCSDKVDEMEVVSSYSTPLENYTILFLLLRPWILTNIILLSFWDDIPSLQNMIK